MLKTNNFFPQRSDRQTDSAEGRATCNYLISNVNHSMSMGKTMQERPWPFKPFYLYDNCHGRSCLMAFATICKACRRNGALCAGCPNNSLFSLAAAVGDRTREEREAVARQVKSCPLSLQSPRAEHISPLRRLHASGRSLYPPVITGESRLQGGAGANTQCPRLLPIQPKTNSQRRTYVEDSGFHRSRAVLRQQ